MFTIRIHSRKQDHRGNLFCKYWVRWVTWLDLTEVTKHWIYQETALGNISLGCVPTGENGGIKIQHPLFNAGIHLKNKLQYIITVAYIEMCIYRLVWNGSKLWIV